MAGASNLRVACVVMQRNESLCLQPWLTYHGALFGFENLFVLDHGSDHPGVIATLRRFADRGVKVRTLLAAADYREKGKIVGAAMQQVDGLNTHDFLLPLDCDEFVAMRDRNGRPSCSRQDILDYFATLGNHAAPLLVEENLLNSLSNPAGFWPLPYQKIFFCGGHAGGVDHGSHNCTTLPDAPLPTRLVYVHYHHKLYATQRELSRQKLRPYVDVEDRVALEAYRGTGWHLVKHLLETEEAYMAGMTEGSLQFPELPALLQELGIDPAFCSARG